MEGDERRPWTLLTSHGHVLVEIARNPQVRVRDISAAIGITERATQAIIADLERAGYVERVRVGRRTNYVLHLDNPFRHAAQDGLLVRPFLELLAGGLAEATALGSPAGTAVPAAPAVPAVPVLPTAPAASALPAGPEVEDGLIPGALPPPEPGPLPDV